MAISCCFDSALKTNRIRTSFSVIDAVYLEIYQNIEQSMVMIVAQNIFPPVETMLIGLRGETRSLSSPTNRNLYALEDSRLPGSDMTPFVPSIVSE